MVAEPETIRFPDHLPVRWSPPYKGVRFYAVRNLVPVSFIIPGSLLASRFGAKSTDPEECVQVYLANRTAINDAARGKLVERRAGQTGPVILTDADFPSATTPPPKAERVSAVYDAGFADNPRLKAHAEQLIRRLEAEVIPYPFRVQASWSLSTASGDPLIVLALNDPETDATALFLFPEEYFSHTAKPDTSLHFFWDQVLRERAKIQSQALQPTAEG